MFLRKEITRGVFTLLLFVTESRGAVLYPGVDCFLESARPAIQREPGAIEPTNHRVQVEEEGLRFSFVAEPGSTADEVSSRTVVTYEAEGAEITLQNAIDTHRNLEMWNRIGEKIGHEENVAMNFTMKREDEKGSSYRLASIGTAVGGLVKIHSRVVCTEFRPQPHRWIQTCQIDPSHADTVKHVKKMDRKIECAKLDTGVRCILTTENELFTQGVAFFKKTAMEQAMAGAVKAARVYAMVRLAILKEANKTEGELRDWYANYNRSGFESCLTTLEKEIEKSPQTKSSSRNCPHFLGLPNG